MSKRMTWKRAKKMSKALGINRRHLKYMKKKVDDDYRYKKYANKVYALINLRKKIKKDLKAIFDDIVRKVGSRYKISSRYLKSVKMCCSRTVYLKTRALPKANAYRQREKLLVIYYNVLRLYKETKKGYRRFKQKRKNRLARRKPIFKRWVA